MLDHSGDWLLGDLTTPVLFSAPSTNPHLWYSFGEIQSNYLAFDVIEGEPYETSYHTGYIRAQFQNIVLQPGERPVVGVEFFSHETETGCCPWVELVAASSASSSFDANPTAFEWPYTSPLGLIYSINSMYFRPPFQTIACRILATGEPRLVAQHMAGMLWLTWPGATNGWTALLSDSLESTNVVAISVLSETFTVAVDALPARFIRGRRP
jgi:hypothetical protein